MFLLDLALGAVLGVIGGMLGIGGGLIAIPAFGLLYGMDQQLAQGTALLMILPNVLIGFLRYRQRNPIAWRVTAAMVAPAVVVTFFAARWSAGLDAALLRKGFGVFLLILLVHHAGLLRWRRAADAAMPAPTPPSDRYLPLVGALSGVMSGVFSIGGGLVVVPALVGIFRFTQTRAQGVALALVIPGSAVALATYASEGHVRWSVGVPFALGGIATVSYGVALAHHLPPRLLRALFGVMIFATAVITLLQT
jgi:uncharacterized membrane protein YfcA